MTFCLTLKKANNQKRIYYKLRDFFLIIIIISKLNIKINSKTFNKFLN